MVSEHSGKMVEELYPFPTHLNVSSFVSTKLTDTNYLGWKLQFEALLRSQKLLRFVDGSLSAPTETIRIKFNNDISEVSNPDYEAWLQTDQLIQSWIFGTLSEEVLGYAFGLSTAHDIWMVLAESFNQSTMSREFDLLAALQSIQKGDKDLTVHLREFKNLCDQLSSIGKPVPESMKIFRLLQSLGRAYESFNTSIQTSMHKPPVPTYNEVVSQLKGFHSRLQTYAPASPNPQMVFQVQNTIPPGPNLNPPQPTYNTQHYNSRGRGRSYGYRGRSGYTTRGRGFSQQAQRWNGQGSSASLSQQQHRPTCQICGRVGHVALRCWNRFDSNYQSEEIPQAFAAMHISAPAHTYAPWYPDSGASSHITNSAANLHDSSVYNGSESVMMADGSFMPITHVGSTSLATGTENVDPGKKT